MKKTALLLLLLIVVHHHCSKPTNPYKEYANVEIEISLDTTSFEDYHTGDTLGIAVALTLPHLIDSVRISAGDWDTTIHAPAKQLPDTVGVLWISGTTGSVAIEAVGYLSNGLTKQHSTELTIKGYPPQLAQDLPTTINKNELETCTLTVAVADSAGVTYVWLKDGDTVAGQTERTFVIASIALQDSGAYQCISANEWGNAAGSVTRISVRSQDAPVAPSNFRLVSGTDSSSTFVWDPVAGATEYYVYRDTAAHTGADAFAVVTGTSYTDTIGGDFYYWVSAVENGLESFPSTAVYTGTGNLPPAWNTNTMTLSLAEGGDTTLHLAALCTDPNSDDTLSWYLTEAHSQDGIVGDTAYVFTAGRLDSGTVSQQIVVSDGQLTDTLVITVLVSPTYVDLSVTAENGSVTKTPSQDSYRWGDTVSLEASAASGYTFDGWFGDASSV